MYVNTGSHDNVLWVPSGKNNLFPGGGTVELSLAGREAVSSENRKDVSIKEVGKSLEFCCEEFVAGWRWRGRTRGWKGREPGSQIWMF